MLFVLLLPLFQISAACGSGAATPWGFSEPATDVERHDPEPLEVDVCELSDAHFIPASFTRSSKTLVELDGGLGAALAADDELVVYRLVDGAIASRTLANPDGSLLSSHRGVGLFASPGTSRPASRLDLASGDLRELPAVDPNYAWAALNYNGAEVRWVDGDEVLLTTPDGLVRAGEGESIEPLDDIAAHAFSIAEGRAVWTFRSADLSSITTARDGEFAQHTSAGYLRFPTATADRIFWVDEGNLWTWDVASDPELIARGGCGPPDWDPITSTALYACDATDEDVSADAPHRLYRWSPGADPELVHSVRPPRFIYAPRATAGRFAWIEYDAWSGLDSTGSLYLLQPGSDRPTRLATVGAGCVRCIDDHAAPELALGVDQIAWTYARDPAGDRSGVALAHLRTECTHD